MTLQELIDLFKDVKAVLGLIPSAGVIVNNNWYSVIPMTPLLRPFVTVTTVVACIVAIGWTLSYARDLAPNDRGKQLRCLAIVTWLAGFLLLGVYLLALTLMQQYPASLRTIVVLLDFVQVMFFVLPFGFWTIAIVVSVSQIRT